MRLGLLFLLCLAPSTLDARQGAKPPDAVRTAAQTATADYAATREIALAPSLQFAHDNNYAAALSAVRPILAAYPHDLRVLFFSADVARINGHFDEALDLVNQCLALKLVSPGGVRLGLVRTYADMGRWTDFNRERATVRQLALDGDRTLSVDQGYVIEDYRGNGQHIQVKEYPSNDPAAITRFRFELISSFQSAAHFIPSFDLEANPVDLPNFAREYPQKAAAHLRPYALASYPDSHSRAFLKFYTNGEPAYQDVRADVMAFAAKPPGTALPPPAQPPHRPAYQPPAH
jgi:hypothetical protein